ncbi:restriction endonuclease subunit S [Clostridium perfringens]
MLKNVKLKELGEIFTGSTPSKKNKEFYNSEDIMFIKPDILDFDIVNIGVSNEYISEKAREKARIIPANSLLVSCIGSIGKLGINEKEVAFNQQINAIVPNNKIKSSRYLAYLLKYNQKKLESIANAPVVPIINKTQFSEFEVLIHENLNFQEQITQILDKSKEIIEKRKEQIQFLDKLVKSKFTEMFGDVFLNTKNFEMKQIKDIVTVVKGITYKPNQVNEEGTIVLRSSNIKGSKFDLNDIVRVNKKIDEKFLVEVNDILMCNRNGSERLVGKVAKIPEYNEPMTFGTFMTIIRSPYYNYLFTFFQTEAFRRQIKMQTSVAINQISIPLLESVKVPLPPIELQNQFADFVKQVDKLKFEMEKSLKELEDNFNSLMQKAFRGELFK